MKPTKNALDQWHQTMTTMGVLAMTLGTDMEHFNPLLQGIITTAVHNPLLRMITVNGVACIAHVTSMFKISIVGLDNPLENTSAKEDLRARIYEDLTSIIIEKNMGPRYKDDVERNIENACSRAGNEMTRTGNFTGLAGQTFSTLLHTTMSHCGSAFRWEKVEQYHLSVFKSIKLIQRAEECEKGIPTFDLFITS